MATVQKISIALPLEMTAIIHQAVETGEYASNSEVVREALRAWNYQRTLQQQTLTDLRQQIALGLNSGVSPLTDIEAVIQAAKSRKTT